MRYFLSILLLALLASCSTSAGLTEHRPDYRASQVHLVSSSAIPPYLHHHMAAVEKQLRRGQALAPADSALVRTYLPNYFSSSGGPMVPAARKKPRLQL